MGAAERSRHWKSSPFDAATTPANRDVTAESN
jgi:hypothetical protein